MKSRTMRFRFFASVIFFVALFATSGAALALTCSSQANGNWDNPKTWSGCGGGFPGAGDDVVIANGRTVTVNVAAQARSVTFASTGGNANLNHNNGISLTVGTGGVTINGSTDSNGTHAWNINAGSATVSGNVTLVEGNSNARIARIALTDGTLTINGNLTMNNASSDVRTVIDMSGGSGNLLLTGNFALANGFGTLTPGNNSAFTYNGGGAQTVATGPSVSYANLVINKSGGTATTSSAPGTRSLTVNGNLAVQSGTFEISGVNSTIGGTTSVSGTLTITSTTGAKTFSDLVTINGSGTWANPANEAVTLQNGLTNNGTFSSGTGTYTFDTNNQQLSGSSGITFSGDAVINRTVTNNTTTTVGGNLSGSSTFINAANQTLNIGGNANGLATLNASASNNTVNYNGGAAQIAKDTTYFHLTISSAGAVTLPGDITLLGNLTDNGNFDPVTGSRTVTFGGSAVQSLLGTAVNTTFYRVTLDNSAGLTLTHHLTATNQLNFSNGVITTGVSRVVIPAGATVAGASSARFVAGKLEKFVATGSAAPVAFTPVTLNFTSVATAGTVIASTSTPDHPLIADSGLNPAASVNRYWTLTNSGVVFANYSATFTFVPGDVDSGANPLGFAVMQYSPPLPDLGTWDTTTLGTLTSTTAQITGQLQNDFGDFAIGELTAFSGVIGRFNAFETTTPPGAIVGVIKTKIAGAAFNVDIVAIKNRRNGVDNGFKGTVRVELLDAGDDSGAIDTNGCRSSWTVIQTLAPDPVFLNTDNGRKTITLTENNAWRIVRIRVYDFPRMKRIGCSTDAFAIRPSGFSVSVSDNDAQTAGTLRALNDVTFGTVTHKAGRPFSVRAQAVNAAGTPAVTTNYNGTPSATVSACLGAACTSSFGVLALNTPFTSGQLASDVATYSEVGSFGLQLVDDAFASIDNADGSTLTERRVASATVNVGRFVPDHFAVSFNTPKFATACAGTTGFTYVGQRFAYTIAPVITVQAQNFSNAPTLLYAGNWWRITNASLTGKSYTTVAVPGTTLDTGDVPATDPVISISGSGTGTLTFSSGSAPGSGLFFTRNSPVAPFDAEISLAINIIDADGVTYAGNPARFGQASAGNGIAFNNGKEMRFGRLRIANASGSNLLPLTLRMETQHWAAPGYFITNTDDNCTTVATANVGLGNFKPSPPSSPFASGDTTPTIAAGPFVNGIKLIKLSAPGGAKTGSVDVVVKLQAPPDALNSCLTFGTLSPTPSTANLPFLRGKWCPAAAGFNRDPTARARFGVYRGADEFIDFRENFIN